MKKFVLSAAAMLALGGCATYDGFGSGYGVSVGYGGGYGGYGTGGYGAYDGYGYPGYGSGSSRCVRYDRYGRAYDACGYGSGYANTTIGVAIYPGYSYRNGNYYDRRGHAYNREVMRRRYGDGRHSRRRD